MERTEDIRTDDRPVGPEQIMERTERTSGQMTDLWDTRTDYGENREDIRTDDRPVGTHGLMTDKTPGLMTEQTRHQD